MNSHFYKPGSLSCYVDNKNKNTDEWRHDIYHSPFKEDLERIYGKESYEELAKYEGCKRAKGGEEAAKRWREGI